MNEAKRLAGAAGRVLVPTSLQIVLVTLVAAGTLFVMQSRQILTSLGISSQAIHMTQQQAAEYFSIILDSTLVGHVALVSFWAAIGLVAYLICWGLYNLIINARNQVTVETEYTNHGQWYGVLETLSLKAVAAIVLMIYISNLQYGLALWMALASGLWQGISVMSVGTAILAVLGLAAQLYFLLVLIQFVVTPWYRPGVFTSHQK